MARTIALVLSLIALVIGAVPSAFADATFTASSGSLSATATFSVRNDVLTVTLTNNSQVAAANPADLLTAVFFDLPGGVSLTPIQAYLSPKHGAGTVSGISEVINPTACVPPNPNCDGHAGVSGEFAYKEGTLAGVTQHYGLSSSGFGIFSGADLFDPAGGLDNPLSPDGINYAILPTAGRADAANSKLYSEPLIQNSVVMELRGVPVGFDPTTITNLRFQYGTDLAEPHLGGGGTPPPPPAVPEPATMALLGSGLIAGLIRRVRRS